MKKSILLSNDGQEHFLSLDIIKAQVFNAPAERCSSISIIIAILFLLFTSIIIAFPFIKERYTHTVAATDMSLYSGLGAAFAAAAQADSFRIVSGEFQSSKEGIYTLGTIQPVNGWIVILNAENPSEFLNLGEYENTKLLIFAKKQLIISNPDSGLRLEGSYSALEGFSSDMILTSLKTQQTAVNLVSAIVFSLATESLIPAMLSILLLMMIQTFVLAVVMSALLNIGFAKRSFISTLKIISVLGLGPALGIGVIGIFFTSFSLTFGWIVYTLILVIRIIVLYMGRLKNKNL